MSDLVAVTLGNSSAALARVAGENVGDVRRVPVDRLADLGDPLRAAAGPGVPVVVASVNPPALAAFRRLAAEARAPRPRVAGADFRVPMDMDVKEPDRVGLDRLLGAFAAWRRVGRACVVIDCGTATTVNVVSAKGVFLGGAIFPGPAVLARALARGTAQLPEVAPGPAASAVGKSTEEAIRAGAWFGWQGGVLALLGAALSEVGDDAPVFLTGGDRDALAPEVPALIASGCGGGKRSAKRGRCEVVPELVLEGLVLAYREHEKR